MAELKKPEEIHQNQDVISKSDPAQNEVETEKSSQEQEVKAEEVTSVSDSTKDQLPVASSSSATAGESAPPQTSPEPPSSPEISPETVPNSPENVPSSPEIVPLDLKTIAASITSVAGAHATQVNASPEDMEFNRLRSTYTNDQGEYVLDSVASEILREMKTPVLSQLPSPTSALFTSASAQELDFEIIDGTKIYNDGRVEIVGNTVFEEPRGQQILPSKTVESEPQLMTEQPSMASEQPPDIQSSVVEANANVESSNDSINVKPTEELDPQIVKSEAPSEHISTSQMPG